MAEPPHNEAGHSILIVDDEPSAIHVLRSALADYSHVRFARNGQDAVQSAQERPPDLILLDGSMPGENGFQVFKRLKAIDELRDVPVIFVTARDDVDFETQALQLGAADFLSKPVSALRVQLRVRLHLQLKRQLDRLRSLSTTDALTGIPNRRSFDERLTKEWNRAERSGFPLALLMVDVDFFKSFNDSYGHIEGDECLKAIATVVAQAAQRPADLAARFGGEEFVVLLPETSAAGAQFVANTLRAAVVNSMISHCASPLAPYVTVSIGGACRGVGDFASAQRFLQRPAEGLPVQSERVLLEAADRALYLAKKGGRNRVEMAHLDPGKEDKKLSLLG